VWNRLPARFVSSYQTGTGAVRAVTPETAARFTDEQQYFVSEAKR
jgi:hypothetical protein